MRHQAGHTRAIVMAVCFVLALAACGAARHDSPGAAPLLQLDRSVGFTTTAVDAATRLSSVPLPAGFVAVVDDHWVPDEHWHELGGLHFVFRRWDGTPRPDDGFSVAIRSVPVDERDSEAVCDAAVRHIEATIAALDTAPVDAGRTVGRCAAGLRALGHAAVSHDEPVRLVIEFDSRGPGQDGTPYVLHGSLAVLGAPGVQPQLALAFQYAPDFTALATPPGL